MIKLDLVLRNKREILVSTAPTEMFKQSILVEHEVHNYFHHTVAFKYICSTSIQKFMIKASLVGENKKVDFSCNNTKRLVEHFMF